MGNVKLNRKIFEWAEANANRCQNWNYRVNKMLKEANIQYQPGVTNPTVIKAKADYLYQKFLIKWTEDINPDNKRQGNGKNKVRTYKLFKVDILRKII